MNADVTLFLKGLAMGAANVIPGVSGGTIALITGIYERLIDAIRRFDVTTARLVLGGDVAGAWRRVDGRWLAVVLGGVVVSIVTLARLFEFLLERHERWTMAFFFGLILLSVLYVARGVTRWSATTLASLAAGTAVAVGIALLAAGLREPERGLRVPVRRRRDQQHDSAGAVRLLRADHHGQLRARARRDLLVLARHPRAARARLRVRTRRVLARAVVGVPPRPRPDARADDRVRARLARRHLAVEGGRSSRRSSAAPARRRRKSSPATAGSCPTGARRTRRSRSPSCSPASRRSGSWSGSPAAARTRRPVRRSRAPPPSATGQGEALVRARLRPAAAPGVAGDDVDAVVEHRRAAAVPPRDQRAKPPPAIGRDVEGLDRVVGRRRSRRTRRR